AAREADKHSLAKIVYLGGPYFHACSLSRYSIDQYHDAVKYPGCAQVFERTRANCQAWAKLFISHGFKLSTKPCQLLLHQAAILQALFYSPKELLSYRVFNP